MEERICNCGCNNMQYNHKTKEYYCPFCDDDDDNYCIEPADKCPNCGSKMEHVSPYWICNNCNSEFEIEDEFDEEFIKELSMYGEY